MSEHPKPERRRKTVVAGIAAAGLLSAAVVGTADGPASAATHGSTKGSLQLCASSTTGRWVHFHVVRDHASLARSMKTVAHRTTCATVSVPKGTYRITETAASGERVSHVSVSPASRALVLKPAAAYARARVAKAHLTRAVFANKVLPTTTPPPTPPPPTPTPPPGPSDPGTGYLEVCKTAGDGYVTGSVAVTITSGTFTDTTNVIVGQCTPAIQVPAGAATVTEAVTSPYYLDSVTTKPSTALVSTDPATSSAVVNVAASTDASIETTAFLVNKTTVGQVKICKALTANTADLVAAGDNAFGYTVAYQAPNSSPVNEQKTIIVPAAGTTQCVLTEPIPVGTQVSITENAATNTTLQSLTVDLPTDQVSVSGRTAVVKVDQNPDTDVEVDYTNSADGTIEVCKQIDDGQWQQGGTRTLTRAGQNGGSPYDGTPFHFSINGASPITVLAGQCSPAIAVPAGTATVSEVQDTPDFNLEGFTATGPDGSSRLTSGINPITVSVPFGGVGNETLVLATNRVQTAQVKVCKELDPSVPVGKSWTFTTRFTEGDRTYDGGKVTLTPSGTGQAGEDCSFLSAPLPVIDPSGKPTLVSVTEGASPFGTSSTSGPIVEPTEIDYAGNGTQGTTTVWHQGDATSLDGTYGTSATLGQGVNEITFVNSLVLDP